MTIQQKLQDHKEQLLLDLILLRSKTDAIQREVRSLDKQIRQLQSNNGQIKLTRRLSV